MPGIVHDTAGREALGQFPLRAGIFLGLGLGGFFDGIVLHQILQWHHMLSSAGYSPDNVADLKFNVMWDGLFHAAAWAFTALGLYLLWRRSRKTHGRWPARALPAAILIGFGAFNLIEGTINHHILGLHHVREAAPPGARLWWDVGFLVWGAAMVLGGLALLRGVNRQPASSPSADKPVRSR